MTQNILKRFPYFFDSLALEASDRISISFYHREIYEDIVSTIERENFTTIERHVGTKRMIRLFFKNSSDATYFALKWGS